MFASILLLKKQNQLLEYHDSTDSLIYSHPSFSHFFSYTSFKLMSYLIITSSSIIRYKLSDLLNYGNFFCSSFLRKALRCPIKIYSDRYTLKLMRLGPVQFYSSQHTGRKPGQLHLMIWYSMNLYSNEWVYLNDRAYSLSILRRFWSIYSEGLVLAIITDLNRMQSYNYIVADLAMEDTQNTTKNQPVEHKQTAASNEEPINIQIDDVDEDATEGIKQRDQKNVKQGSKIQVDYRQEQNRQGEHHQGKQCDFFDQFEDSNELPLARAVEKTIDRKADKKQEKVSDKVTQIKVRGQNKQQTKERPPTDNPPIQKQQTNNVQSLKDNQNALQVQPQAITQQNIPKSPQQPQPQPQNNEKQSPNKKQPHHNQPNSQKQNIKFISGSIVLRQAEKERIGSIFQNFRTFNRQYEQITSSYKLIVRNVICELKQKATYKSHLQETLVDYFENYSKIHKEFDQRVFKLGKASKEENLGSTNKYLNMKEYFKVGSEQLIQLRKSIGMNNQKLDGYINNYVISSIKQIFEDYCNEIAAEERRQLSQKQDFIKEQKVFKKVIQNLDKLCKKSIEGDKTNEDIFMQLSNYINRERAFRKVLIRYGKTVIQLRKNYVGLEIKLFEKMQKILNQFKNEQKMVYVAPKEFNFIQDFLNLAEENTKYENLCTITDVDYIKGVLKLQNRKERTSFQNHHFEQYLQMPFMDPLIADAKKLLKGAIKKSFPLNKANFELVHTISQNLIEYDKELNECHERIVIKNVNASIIGEGAIEFSEMMKKVIFTQHRTIRMQLQSEDRAQQLISYLNEMQLLGKN